MGKIFKFENSIKTISEIVKEFLTEYGGNTDGYMTSIDVKITDKTNPNSFGWDLGQWETEVTDNMTVKYKRELMRKLVATLHGLIINEFKNLINYINITSKLRDGGSYRITVNVGWFEYKELDR